MSFSYSFRPDEVYSSRWKLVFNESTVLFQRKSTSTNVTTEWEIYTKPLPCFCILVNPEIEHVCTYRGRWREGVIHLRCYHDCWLKCRYEGYMFSGNVCSENTSQNSMIWGSHHQVTSPPISQQLPFYLS